MASQSDICIRRKTDEEEYHSCFNRRFGDMLHIRAPQCHRGNHQKGRNAQGTRLALLGIEGKQKN